MKQRFLVLAAALAACGTAQAAGIGVRAGTTGLGADVAFNVAPTFDARVGYSAGSWGYDTSTNGASYSGDVKLSNLNAFVDWRPLIASFFRVTGGVVFNKNKYEATGHPAGGIGSFDATVESGKSAAPYLGIGYGAVAGAGVNFYADLGVMFMGEPKATLTANCAGISGAQCTSLNNQVTAEQQRLQDELKRFRYYPVLNLGITIGF
jgi:hypothetical protein